MLIPEKNFTQEDYEKLQDEWFRQLFEDNKKELARPGPKSAAQTPAPPKEVS